MQSMHHESIGNVGQLILHLEWHLLPEQLAVLSKAILQCSNDCLQQSNSALQRAMILRLMKEMVGNSVYFSVLSAIKSDYRAISCGLAPAASLITKGCPTCHGPRILHSFCICCGNIFALGYESIEPVSISIAPPAASLAQSFNNYLTFFEMESSNTVKGSFAKKYEVMAIRGIKSLGRLANHSHGFNELGGDMMFLLRNIVFACSGSAQQAAMTILRQLIMRWIDMEDELFDEEKCICSSEVHLEALHTMIHLLRVYDQAYPDKAEAQLEAIKAQKEQNSKRRRRLTESEELELALAASIAESKLHPQQQQTAVVSETASDENRSLEEDNTIAYAEQIILVNDDEAMKIRAFVDKCKAYILHLMEYETLYDWFGYDPMKHTVPTTAVNYCNGCGEEWKGNDHHNKLSTHNSSKKSNNNSKKKKSAKSCKLNHKSSSSVDSLDNSNNNDLKNNKICPHCGSKVEQCIDYYALTAAVCWIYIWHDCNIDICDDSDPTGCVRNSTLGDVILILQQVRSYQTLHQLHTTGFINQCYFITHLIYAFSDWGQHILPRHLFAEEFQFIVDNLSTVMELENCELVGEFLQCLRILEYSPSRSADLHLQELEAEAMDYLLREGKEPGLGASGTGPWLALTQTFYTQYHTSYCAAMGLLNYRFQDHQDKKPLRLSSMIKYLEEAMMEGRKWSSY